jgi:hypothetical protein
MPSHTGPSRCAEGICQTDGDANLWSRFTRYEMVAGQGDGDVHYAPSTRDDWQPGPREERVPYH